MPTYTYHCDDCGVQFDRVQKFSDQPLTRCPECGKKSLRKVYSPVGIIYKGSGFYSTDNRSPSGAPRAGASKSAEKTESVKPDAGKTSETPAASPSKPAESKS
ncbi:MAG: FmdB family zinc ribbon protein [Anaerolineaceae bacterium]